MSIKIMSDVWRNSKASGSALLVLLAIADFANDEGSSYPSISTLAAKARMSVRNARYVIDDLVKADELVVKRSAGPKGCNLFKVGAAIFAGVQGLQGAKIAGVQSVQAATGFPEGVQPASPGAAIAIAPEPSLTIIEPSIRNPGTKSEKLGIKALIDLGVDEQVARDWLVVRKEKHAPLTVTALNDLKREATKAGISVHDAVLICAQRSWQSLRADWLRQSKRKNSATDVGLASIDYAAELPGGRP